LKRPIGPSHRPARVSAQGKWWREGSRREKGKQADDLGEEPLPLHGGGERAFPPPNPEGEGARRNKVCKMWNDGTTNSPLWRRLVIQRLVIPGTVGLQKKTTVQKLTFRKHIGGSRKKRNTRKGGLEKRIPLGPSVCWRVNDKGNTPRSG